MQQNQQMTLSDGRVLAYAEYGLADGSPVFYFHGGNGSRIEAEWFDESAKSANVRLIAPDRPGFGLSDFQQNRTFLDWAEDVSQLADSLNIKKFSIFGLSGGAPHVVALAHAIPERLKHVAIVSGVTPPQHKDKFTGMWFPVRLFFITAKYLPAMSRFILKQQGSFYADKEMMMKRMLQAMPEPDKDLLKRRPEIVDIFARDAQEAHRQGIEGDAHEWQLYVDDWGFPIEDITMPVALWYGEYDSNTPIEMGDYYARTLPDVTLNCVPDGGHFSTINNHIDTILAYLSA